LTSEEVASDQWLVASSEESPSPAQTTNHKSQITSVAKRPRRGNLRLRFGMQDSGISSFTLVSLSLVIARSASDEAIPPWKFPIPNSHYPILFIWPPSGGFFCFKTWTSVIRNENRRNNLQKY